MLEEWAKEEILPHTGNIKSTERLGNALCNRVYFLDAANGRYIVKIADGEKRRRELKNEAAVLAFLRGQIDVPEVFLHRESEKISCLLMEYIDGEVFQSLLENNGPDITGRLSDLGRTLQKIHSVKLPWDYQYREVMDRHLAQAEMNRQNGLLDPDEFVADGMMTEPGELLRSLVTQGLEMEETRVCLLHGDFRPKNILVNNGCVVVDWGFCAVGDPYYDLAMILYYLNRQERAVFLEGYGIKDLDCARLTYFGSLSKYINV